MKGQLQEPRARQFVPILGILVLLVSSCESQSTAYKRGVSDGYSRGLADGQAQAAATGDSLREAGFKEGFEAARPTAAAAASTGAWRTLSIVVMVLGMAKIVLSLVVFVCLLIHDSKSWADQLAKIIATTLAGVVVFWLYNSFTVGFSQSLTDALLDPAASTPGQKLVTGVVAAAIMWGGLWLLEFLGALSQDNAYVQTAFVLVASAMVSILVPLFVSLQSVPNIVGYRFFDLILGVVMGGILWLVHRLLVESRRMSAKTPRLGPFRWRVLIPARRKIPYGASPATTVATELPFEPDRFGGSK